MKIERFEDLIAWQKARQLTKRVYLTSREGPFAHDFGMCNQIRKSALSVPSNIAEGHAREDGRAAPRRVRIVRPDHRLVLPHQPTVTVAMVGDAVASELLQPSTSS